MSEVKLTRGRRRALELLERRSGEVGRVTDEEMGTIHWVVAEWMEREGLAATSGPVGEVLELNDAGRALLAETRGAEGTNGG